MRSPYHDRYLAVGFFSRLLILACIKNGESFMNLVLIVQINGFCTLKFLPQQYLTTIEFSCLKLLRCDQAQLFYSHKPSNAPAEDFYMYKFT